MKNGLNLPKHMAEHIYMFCGESVTVKMKAQTDMMDDLIDWFGRGFRILEKEEESIVISLKCNYNAMFYWALQYGAYVEMLAPEKLREELAETVRGMNEKYNMSEEER